MTHRERMRSALRHEEPDRVPIDFGQDFHNGIHEVAYGRLMRHLGIALDGPPAIYDFMQRLALVDQRVLERFTLIPLAVGDAEPEAVAAVLERLWGARRP